MDIWANIVSDFYKLENLTDKDIEFAEKCFSIKIPKKYIELLKIQNGGFINFNALDVRGKFYEGNNYIYIDHLLGVKQNEGILQTDYLKNEWDIKKENIVIISGNGHSWIALDYNMTVDNEPSVIYIDTNEETKITKIFNNFGEMLQNLCTESVNGDVEGSIQIAKELLKSSEIEKIIDGLIMWETFFTGSEEIEFFFNRMLELVDIDDENIKFGSTMIVYNYVEKKYIKDIKFISIFLEKLSEEKSEHIQYFIECIRKEVR